MQNFFKTVSLVFAAGCFGGLVKALVAWWSGAAGVNAFLGFKMAPSLTAMWIYQHMVWGGLWAFLFLLPVKGSYYSRGVLYSLGQTAVQLLVIFPNLQKGMLGLELGAMAPVLITIFGVVWGLATGFWLKQARGRG